MEFIEFIKQWGGWIIGSAGLSGYFFFPYKRAETDKANALLIKTLQDTVNALDGRVNQQDETIKVLEENHKKNEAEITTIKAEKETVLKILQGRDEKTISFQEHGFKAMEQTGQMYEMMKSLVQCINDLSKGINTNNTLTANFVKTISDHFLTVEKVAITPPQGH